MSSPIPMVGSRAPDFSLPATRVASSESGLRTLADYRDRWLVLFFYPRDFSLVCPTEVTAMSARIAEFKERECDILGVSTDSLATHERWIATPYYMSPEQTRGSPASSASDLFSLGLIVFEVFANRRAVTGTTLTEVLQAVNNLDAEALARGVPDPYANVVRRMLDSDPSSRAMGLSELLRLPDQAQRNGG